MSATAWLKGQRKSELVELAHAAGLKDHDNLKKADLETALDDYLQKHSSTLAKKSALQPYYNRAGISSPSSKKEAAKAADEKPKATKRKSKSDDTAAVALVTHSSTPRRNLAIARTVPLPPSPAVIADAIDRRTQALRTKAARTWKDAGVTKRAEGVRESLSSVVSIEALVLLVEAYGLRAEVLPLRYAFTIPAIALLRTPDYAVALPDLFLLVTSAFWSPFTLWISTSLIIPLAFAYFFNLTVKPKAPAHKSSSALYKFDPMTFNIAKALVAFLVFFQDVKFGGLVSEDSVDRIRGAVPGGATGLIMGAAIGGLTTFYEAVLRK